MGHMVVHKQRHQRMEEKELPDRCSRRCRSGGIRDKWSRNCAEEDTRRLCGNIGLLTMLRHDASRSGCISDDERRAVREDHASAGKAVDTAKRWMAWDGDTAEECLQDVEAIPPGVPWGPLALNVYMWAGFSWATEEIDELCAESKKQEARAKKITLAKRTKE